MTMVDHRLQFAQLEQEFEAAATDVAVGLGDLVAPGVVPEAGDGDREGGQSDDSRRNCCRMLSGSIRVTPTPPPMVHLRYEAPLTSITVPVLNSDPGLTRNITAFATSSGRATLPVGL